MEEQVKELIVAGHADAEGLLTLGRWLGPSPSVRSDC
jgi:hypothetical protein